MPKLCFQCQFGIQARYVQQSVAILQLCDDLRHADDDLGIRKMRNLLVPFLRQRVEICFREIMKGLEVEFLDA